MYACFIVANAGLTIITILMTTPECVMDTVRGWLAVGTIPAGISIAAIGPFLLQPAGGFWNFWHTYWVREKGMGMGAYFGRVTGLAFRPEDIRRSGYMVDYQDPNEIRKFNQWMKLNWITLIVFFVILGGIWFTFIASLAGYTAAKVYGLEVPSGWRIAVIIAEIFGKVWGPLAFSLFGIVIAASLFDSQFSIYDGIARMWTDTIYTEHPKVAGRRPYRFWYFVMLGALVTYGICCIPLGTPYFIWLIANRLGTLTQPFITLLLIYMNRKYLPKPLRPKWYHVTANVAWSIVLISYFIIWTIFEPPRLGI